MRILDFFEEDLNGDQYAGLITALSLLHKRVKDGEIPVSLPTSMILRYVRNTGSSTFNYEDLINANESNPIMKKYISNITPEQVKFNKGLDTAISNPEEITAAAENPQEKVSKMADRALKRRQK
jgi:hypothetical protein